MYSDRQGGSRDLRDRHVNVIRADCRDAKAWHV